VGGTGGPAFKLQKPPQMRVPVLRVGEEPALSEVEGAGTTTAYTTDGVERTGAAPAESPTLAKNARMGHHSVGVVQCKDGPPAEPLGLGSAQVFMLSLSGGNRKFSCCLRYFQHNRL
jgi:hypothetical protein